MRRTPLQKMTALCATDRTYWQQCVRVAGMDEVGRGPLAGPVVAACVVMPEEPLILGVDDSKKLSAPKREALYAAIMEAALFVGVGTASVEEIDTLNILGATKLAMQRAAQGVPCDLLLIDALEGLHLPVPQRGIVHGDACCYNIAAASIVAKVTRDAMLVKLDAAYPAYGFAQHKGYGTAAHIAAIQVHGPCPAHRRAFIRNIVEARA